MYPFFSIYLDLCRALAAFCVFIGHIPPHPYVTEITDKFNFGYDSVIVFFVLSGYVISYAAAEAEKTWLNYVVSRIARIFPVAFTSVILSLIFSYLAHDLRPDLYENANQLKSIPYYSTLSLLFLNQIWWLNIKPFENAAYWTLPFEVWDYVFYGVLIFLKGRTKLFWLAFILLLNGPKFLLLLPVWLAGSFAYKWRDKFVLSKQSAIALSITPIVIYIIFKASLPSAWSWPLVGQKVEHLLGHGLDGAAGFFWANILGILVALHLFAIRRSEMKFLEKPYIASPIKWFAKSSFSLYIYHVPVIHFLDTYLRPEYGGNHPEGKVAIYMASLSIIYVLSLLVEQKKSYFKQGLLVLSKKISKFF